ncbi:aspartate/glutamate racemase family protein [Lederbergia ruris]|uniref:aspartate/glutamate racemase family protein n=1 Tax=Lederbergia ruris TaxID=217495 RepID=UPI0039A2DDA8
MSKKLAIIHTTPVTVDSLKKLANEKVPGVEVVNFVDDSILPQLIDNGGNVEEVENRLIQYAKFAEQVGADIVLNACSSVGEVVTKMRDNLAIPVVRIDEVMAKKAIESGDKIGVVATLATTLNPTMNLLKEKANALNKSVELLSEVAKESYQLLLSGNQEGHDTTLAKVLKEMAEKTDVVVLAQASMARVVATLPVELRGKFLSSPELGMDSVSHLLKKVAYK